MKVFLSKIFKISPNYFSFISGILGSTAINLYTTLMASDTPSPKMCQIVISSLFLIISSLTCALLSWELESINRLAIQEVPAFLDYNGVWQMLVGKKILRLSFILFVSIIFLIGGLLVISF